MTTPDGWLLMAVGDRRQHGGNDGYDDQPEMYYRWDSTVPNHAALSTGDAIAVWDKAVLLGCSVIETIETGREQKTIFRCRFCERSGIKKRSSKSPLYRCYECRQEFDEPLTRDTEVVTYRSRHDLGWIDMSGAFSGQELRGLCVEPKSQHSMRRLRWDEFSTAATRAGWSLRPLRAVQEMVAGGHTSTLVRARIGQGGFRRHLLAEQGPVCAFTGPAPVGALDAAHLYSYASVGVHHAHGGLILRRDIHRLFDCGMLAVQPATNRIDVSSELSAFNEYQRLHGRPLHTELSTPQRNWLQDHWRQHRE